MDKGKLPFALAHRLRFIDFLLAGYDTIDRSAICSFFVLSMPQASHNFATYQQIGPHDMKYDKTSKTYRRKFEFERVFP
ncbi:hypothetical protein SAMN02787142_7659 [Burkholderia sp. WP9]|uniref:hypothetical protein n=1 Tax=Burkholderia sp. WP9 TaxID=1500263 RepID=UPI000899921C|nr:hypothetical protein [Burkholderia sp. WP9]SEF11194.1 hypothetical protein SAMN02787142_7659 [Burkholderia sp. WP9]